jgi:hypothetical protein
MISICTASSASIFGHDEDGKRELQARELLTCKELRLIYVYKLNSLCLVTDDY